MVPLYNSVTSATELSAGAPPPNAKAAVCVPAPAKYLLAVFKSFTSVQLVPFQVSVSAETFGPYPPKAKAAV